MEEVYIFVNKSWSNLIHEQWTKLNCCENGARINGWILVEKLMVRTNKEVKVLYQTVWPKLSVGPSTTSMKLASAQNQNKRKEISLRRENGPET